MYGSHPGLLKKSSVSLAGIGFESFLKRVHDYFPTILYIRKNKRSEHGLADE